MKGNPIASPIDAANRLATRLNLPAPQHASIVQLIAKAIRDERNRVLPTLRVARIALAESLAGGPTLSVQRATQRVGKLINQIDHAGGLWLNR